MQTLGDFQGITNLQRDFWGLPRNNNIFKKYGKKNYYYLNNNLKMV